MNDESAPSGTEMPDADPTDPVGPPPPPGRPVGPRRLRRSNDDRIVAGVCGGIGDHFGIDPIIVRLAFVALALLGGSGIGIYLIAWLVMPRAHEDESAAINALRGGNRPGGRALAVVGLLLAALLVISGSVFWIPLGDGLFLPLLILAAGIALLVWPAEGGWHGRWHLDDDGWKAERAAAREEWRREREEWRRSRHEWTHGYRRGVPDPSDDDGAADTTDHGPAGPPRRGRRGRRRPRPFLGPITVALLLVYTGLTVLAERLDWWHTDPAAFLAVCLTTIGVVLTLSAFVGRARGLIGLGLLLLPLAWAIAAADLTWWEGIGEELVRVEQVEDLDDEYRWGMGEFHVDLSDLELDGADREVAVGLTIGELKVWVPDDVEVVADVDGRIGSVIVTDESGRRNDDGVDVALDRTLGDDRNGRLLLDVDIGIGEAEVIVCGSEAVPCP